MTHSMFRPVSQRRKVACSTGATLPVALTLLAVPKPQTGTNERGGAS